MAKYEMPFSDPTPTWLPPRRASSRPPGACWRVTGSRRSRSNIAAEAGENPALIRYHFGSKAGLITALVDSVMYQEAVELIEQLAGVPAGRRAPPALLPLHEGLRARHWTRTSNFFELVPHILRDDELRPHLRRAVRLVPQAGRLGAQGRPGRHGASGAHRPWRC